jgi:hypothetical protein
LAKFIVKIKEEMWWDGEMAHATMAHAIMAHAIMAHIIMVHFTIKWHNGALT